MMEDCADQTEALFEELSQYLGELPRPVKIVVWADDAGNWQEREALRLAAALAHRFEPIAWEARPRKKNYDYYPVFGLMGLEDGAELDFGVRIIGLPAGRQITSLVGGAQAVSFRGKQLGIKTQIQLAKLPAAIDFELIVANQDEAGVIMASRCFNIAAANPKARAFLIMLDDFPFVVNRFNVQHTPHLVINDKIHAEGMLDEADILKLVAKAVKMSPEQPNN